MFEICAKYEVYNNNIQKSWKNLKSKISTKF